MSSSLDRIEELLLKAAVKDNSTIYSEILNIVASIPAPLPQAVEEGISIVIETWQLEPTESEERTKFLIEVSKYFKQDFPDLRSSLPAIVKKNSSEGI